ncbi:MAG: hypothetical protein JSV77_11270 [Dehalococcoidales bacterium]|nr:MAG: hypothetical protein JSV77_11270 [Dehalococcoidales bacterium]
MKRKIISVLIVLAILASGLTACTTKNIYLIQAIKIAPEDTIAISCLDVEAAAEDPDFEPMYDVFLERTMGRMISGVDVADVSASSVARTIDNDIVYILIGNFNLEDIRDALTDEGWIEDEYEGIEIWTGGIVFAVAVIDDMIVTGYIDSVEECVRIHKDEEPSMYDNEDTRAVADKLPVVPSCVVATADYTPPELEDMLSEIEYLAYSMGISNENRDDEVLDVSAWFKFDSEARAEAAMEYVEDFVENGVEVYTSISARLNGQFIEITAEMEIQ